MNQAIFSLARKYPLYLFELLTYGLEGGPMEPEVILQSSECGYDDLGPFYSTFPKLVQIDYASAELRALSTYGLHYGGRTILHAGMLPNLQFISKKGIMNMQIQMQAAVESVEALRKAFVISEMPDTGPEFNFTKSKKRYGRREKIYFGRGRKHD